MGLSQEMASCLARIHRPGFLARSLQVKEKMSTRSKQLPLYFLFLVARLVLFAGLPLEGLRGYGDMIHFFQQAGLGWPFFNFWVEYPPVFPFLSALLYRLSGESEHGYLYLMAGVLSLAQAGGLALFQRLATRLYGPETAQRRSWVYFALLVCLPFSWWSFDGLAVTSMLLGILWLLEGRGGRAGLALGLGILTKWFPGLVLVLAWRLGGARRALHPATAAALLVGSVFFGLYLLAPENTLASLLSQPGKGSWETVWALLDGNYQTGNFGTQIDPLDPSTAVISSRNPARLSPWLTLPFFAGAGLWLSRRSAPGKERESLAFLGLAWCLFLLWMPGYSPQWVLYLLPLSLLALPERMGILAGIALILVDLLEWPVLLSRGLFWGLWLTVPLRAALLLMVGSMFWQAAHVPKSFIQAKPAPEGPESAWAKG
jgi:hypothetical protein